jgi:hypothetical protein
MDFADGSAALDRCSILHPTGRSIQKSYSDGNEESILKNQNLVLKRRAMNEKIVLKSWIV